MDIQDCSRGLWNPKFHNLGDLAGIRQALANNGCAFAEGCGGASDLSQLSRALGNIATPRNEVGAGTGVSNIRFAPDLAGKGYSSEELFFHTDRSGWDLPPGLLLTSLQVKSETGGESLLVDSVEVIAAIKSRHPKLYGLITDAKFSSFRNDDGIFVPRPIFDERTGILRFRFDDGIQLSASLVDAYPTLRALIYEFARPLSLQPGQCYIIDNHRFLHGRTSFTGERELLRTLVYPSAPVEIKPILFDIDGTLCRSEALSIDAFYRCLSDLTNKPITNENTHVNLHGQTDLSLVQDILHYHNHPEPLIASTTTKFLALHPQYLEDSLARGFRSERCPDADQLLDWLVTEKNHRQAGSPSHPGEPILCIGLLTGNSQRNALLKLRAAGINPSLFELNISAFGDRSPNREALVQDSLCKLEARFGRKIARNDVTLVGDTPLDIQCAKRTGCGIVAVATGNYTKGQLDSLGPDLTCDRLPEAKMHLSAVISSRG